MNDSTAIAALAGVPDMPQPAEPSTVTSTRHRLQAALAEAGTLKRALATSREEANAARGQVEVCKAAISRLRLKVFRLEQEVAQVRHFAYHDELTGLPNRSLLLDRLNQAIVHAARQRKHVALLLLDLDGFKSINDHFGHATGDMVLRHVAVRLRSCIRVADTACRFGGDEFVVLLSDVDSEKSAGDVARKIRRCLAKPYSLNDDSISITASIGVAVYPFDGIREDDLIKQADNAMYRAKANANPVAASVRMAPGI